jgi:hypothetical protein
VLGLGPEGLSAPQDIINYHYILCMSIGSPNGIGGLFLWEKTVKTERW